MRDEAAADRTRSVARLAASIAIALAVGAVGGAATARSVHTWYAGLSKPAFTPPDVVFGPAWTVLYILMAVAAWRIFERSTGQARRTALLTYAAQLALNLAWSWIFFGLEAPLAALAEMGLLIVAVLAAGWRFWRLDRAASLLLVPYFAWTCFAFALNLEIWRLNR